MLHEAVSGIVSQLHAETDCVQFPAKSKDRLGGKILTENHFRQIAGVMAKLFFFIVFVPYRRRFATSVPVERSSPLCQGTKVSIRIFFPYFLIAVYILKISKLSMSLSVFSQPNSVSNGKTLSKNENLQKPKNHF